MEKIDQFEEAEIHHGNFRRHSMAVAQSHAGTNDFHRRPLELYLVRINPACRMVWFYADYTVIKVNNLLRAHWQHNIPHLLIDIDFSKDEDQLPEAVKKHPHREVPIIVDGEFVVFECPAILTYLASNYTDHAGYGTTLQTRMQCESLLSWANAELHRAVGYNYIYPQFLEKYTLSSETANEVLVESGLKLLSHHLEILEKKYLVKSRFLTGNRITIADSYIGTILLQAEWTGMKLKMWPKVEQWLTRVKQQVHWNTVHLSHNLFLRELGRAAMFD